MDNPLQSTLPIYELAYIAGLFDGEGCVALHRFRGRKNRCDAAKIALTCSITNTDKRAIDFMQSRFKGSVACEDRSRHNHKNSWKWAIFSRQAAAFLKEILPFLVLKKERAILAIQFADNLLDLRYAKPQEKPAEVERRESLYRRMKAMNKRGVSPIEQADEILTTPRP